MASESDSEHDADERNIGWLPSSDGCFDAATRAGNGSGADASEWIASFRDVHFAWNEPGRVREASRRSDDEWLLSLKRELHTKIDVHTSSDTAADSREPGEWWRISPFEPTDLLDEAGDELARRVGDVPPQIQRGGGGAGGGGGGNAPEPAIAEENLPASPADTDGRTRTASGVATVVAQAFGDMWTARPSRKRVASVAAVVVLLVVVGVIGVLALMGRNDGADSSSSVATTARSKSSTTTTSGSAAATTITPPATPSPPSALPSTPVAFTVLSTCGGPDCTVAVREGPNTAAKTIRSVRAGEVVQITCSVHGESIEDPDTGQRSDMWYRLADTSGYSSAVYLEGRTVPDCG
jgi:Bacterial SH3 domain